MSLDQTTRGVLDQIIDGIIRDIPNFIKIIYNPSEKSKLHIKNESDFLLGVSLGLLHEAFSNYFITAYRRYPNEQEILLIHLLWQINLLYSTPKRGSFMDSQLYFEFIIDYTLTYSTY